MNTPSEQTTYADDRREQDDVGAYHDPMPRAGRSVAEKWILSLLGVLLVGLMGLLGWTWYALSTVKAELREVQAHVSQLHASVAAREPRSPGGEAAPEATAQRLHALEQRLSAVESWTRDTAPRVTALEQHPREKVAKPPPPSPLPALPPATQLPRNATSAPRTPQDHQADRDMRQQAAASGRLGAPVPESFGRWLEWQPAWELRWLRFQSSGQPAAYLYHITYKPDPQQRYTIYWDPDRRTWQQWALWQRVP
jgi:hypothetical protein